MLATCVPTSLVGPDPPTQLTALEITSTSLTITWKPSRSIVGSDDTVNYLINVTDTEGKKVVLHNKDNGAIPVLRVAKLDPDHVYQVTVAAVSGERISSSVTLFVKTYLDPSPGTYAQAHVCRRFYLLTILFMVCLAVCTVWYSQFSFRERSTDSCLHGLGWSPSIYCLCMWYSKGACNHISYGEKISRSLKYDRRILAIQTNLQKGLP